MICVSPLSAEKVSVGDGIVLPNEVALKGKTTDGTDMVLIDVSSSNNTVVGYGGYVYKVGATNIYGNEIYLIAAAGGWKPYYTKGDSITLNDHQCGGFITTSGTAVCFHIPCARPIVGSSSVSISGSIIVRQDGKYLYGSSGSSGVSPSSVNSWINASGMIEVYANMPNTTNATNNHACGVVATLTIAFT